MLNKMIKNLFKSEQETRETFKRTEEIFIDQLLREDIELDEKQYIADKVKELLARDAKIDEKNSKYWYNIGQLRGMTKGALIVAGSLVMGYAVGTLAKK